MGTTAKMCRHAKDYVAGTNGSKGIMEENENVFDFQLSDAQMEALHGLEAPEEKGRLCWKSDPLQILLGLLSKFGGSVFLPLEQRLIREDY